MDTSVWKQEAERLRDQGKGCTEIANEIAPLFGEATHDTVWFRVYRHLKRYDASRASKGWVDPDKTKIVFDTLKKGGTIYEIIEKSGLSDRQATDALHNIAVQGYVIKNTCGFLQISNVVADSEPNVFKEKWDGESLIRFGLMGDTQLNSKYTQITYLHELYDLYEREGIKDVYHTGDIDEGEEMRPGHKYECYTQGADDHIAEIVRVYPRREGINTQFIIGNHDASFIKHAGLDIGTLISQKRDDMKYLGPDNAVIELTPNCKLELSHPGKGSAYAISYTVQKIIEAMSSGCKPNILAVGHFHKTEYLFYRNIHAFQTGTLQAQTPWMKRQSLSAHMGGWIIEAYVNDDGGINRIKQEFIPFYKALADDYLNWR